MKTRAELWAEFDRLVEADEFEQATLVLEKIEPVSDEVWLESLRNAPIDDEPITPREQARVDALRAALSRHAPRAAS